MVVCMVEIIFASDFFVACILSSLSLLVSTKILKNKKRVCDEKKKSRENAQKKKGSVVSTQTKSFS